MSAHFPLMIPGAEPDSVLHEVHSPFDGSPIATVEQANRGGGGKGVCDGVRAIPQSGRLADAGAANRRFGKDCDNHAIATG